MIQERGACQIWHMISNRQQPQLASYGTSAHTSTTAYTSEAYPMCITRRVIIYAHYAPDMVRGRLYTMDFNFLAVNIQKP